MASLSGDEDEDVKRQVVGTTSDEVDNERKNDHCLEENNNTLDNKGSDGGQASEKEEGTNVDSDERVREEFNDDKADFEKGDQGEEIPSVTVANEKQDNDKPLETQEPSEDNSSDTEYSPYLDQVQFVVSELAEVRAQEYALSHKPAVLGMTAPAHARTHEHSPYFDQIQFVVSELAEVRAQEYAFSHDVALESITTRESPLTDLTLPIPEDFVKSLEIPESRDTETMSKVHCKVYEFLKTMTEYGYSIMDLGQALAESRYLEATINESCLIDRLCNSGLSNTLLNLSDASAYFAKKLGRVGGVHVFTNVARSHHPTMEPLPISQDGGFPQEVKVEESDVNLIVLALSILHNIALHDGQSPSFEIEGTAEVAFWYTTFPNARAQVVALMVLAHLETADNNSRLMDRTDTIRKIVQFIEESLKRIERIYQGFSAWELTEALSKLAVNDDNKYKIIKEGALRPLLKMLKGGISKEQEVSANCLWALAFKEDAREILAASKELVATLDEIQKSIETPRLVKIAAQGALWMIRKQDVSSARSYTLSRLSSPSLAHHTSPEFSDYIFISYSWNEQPLVLQIYETLSLHGYKVWIDVNNLKGSIMEAMAEGVANAALVLLCVSDKYYESNNCRTEAEYTYKLKKDYIPLVVQPQFKPKKWLDALMGIRKYYDFHGKDNFEQIMRSLVRDMGAKGKAHRHDSLAPGDGDGTDGGMREDKSPPHELRHSTFHHVPDDALPRERKSFNREGLSLNSDIMKAEDGTLTNAKQKSQRSELIEEHEGDDKLNLKSVSGIRSWLKSYGLQRLVPTFERATDTELDDLNRIRRMAPDTFFKCLKEEYGLTLLEMGKFWRALADI